MHFSKNQFFLYFKILKHTSDKDPLTQRLSRHLLNDLANTMQLKRLEYRFFTQKLNESDKLLK